MFERKRGCGAVLTALLATALAVAAKAAEVPAPPTVRPTTRGQSATTPVMSRPAPVGSMPKPASEMQPATIGATSAIRSVASGAAMEDRPRVALIASGRDAALAGTLQRTLQPLGGRLVRVPLAPGGSLSGIAIASTGNYATPAARVVSAAPVARIAWEGELRYRYESRLQLDYRVPGTFGRAATQPLADRADFSILRTRVGATLKMGPGVHGCFNLQDARSMGAEGLPLGTLANADLFNAWLDLDSIGMRPLHLRVGRQELSYGEGRVLAASEWSNTGRRYDGARLRWAPGHAQLDGFLAWIKEGRVAGQDRVLSGFDALWCGSTGFEAEAYHFRRSFGDAGWTSELGNRGGLHDATSGLRTRALRGPFELRLEGARQRGRRAGDAVNAGFAVGRITADLRSAWQTRLYAEHALSSGDSNPTDANFQRFDPVYWGGHDFQGRLDIAGESNMSDWCGGLTARPVRGWTVQSEYHAFSLVQAGDVWVDDSGNTLRRDLTGAAGTAVGREFDATLRWDTRSRVSVLAGGSRFWRGEFVRKTGGGGDVSWGFVQLNARF